VAHVLARSIHHVGDPEGLSISLDAFEPMLR
jgi:hypothetical protein